MNTKSSVLAAAIVAFAGACSLAQAAAPVIYSIQTPGGATPQSNVSCSVDVTDEDGDLISVSISITGPGNIHGYQSSETVDGYTGSAWANVYTAYSGSYLVEVTATDSENNVSYDSTYFDAEWWWG